MFVSREVHVILCYLFIVPKEIKVKTLQKDLKAEAYRWYELGFQLRVPSSELKKIQNVKRNTPRACFMHVIDYWLEDGQDKTWEVTASQYFGFFKSQFSPGLLLIYNGVVHFAAAIDTKFI